MGAARTGITHSLGGATNTLGANNKALVGQQASLNLSGYGGYYSAVCRDSTLNEQLQLNTLGKNGALNLSCLLR